MTSIFDQHLDKNAANFVALSPIGFDITHVYGLTEVYGPASVAVKRTQWASASLSEQTRLNGRQGVRYPLQKGLTVMDPDRYVKIKGRSKDIIISGGENISSIEVEDALYRHPAVLACAVVARPDAKWGESPVAYVELKPGSEVTAAQLMAHCKALLAGYKVPRDIRFEAIPKTSTGKIQKFELRDRARHA